MAQDDPRTTDPDGRVVVFDSGTRLHLALGRLRRWLRVVVDFDDEPAWVVTALVQENPPRGWNP
ncbi:MAG TPA: hypothetical protein VN892_13105 [Solirubrobacteraceae bacterium]|nr:hypothetical protein [Solirubrobacteraceae bacterium]